MCDQHSDTLALGKRFSDISVKNKHLIQIEINVVFGYRCNQLPLIERSPQWLSGPSLPLSVTAGPPVGYRTGFKWCSDAQYFYSTTSIGWHKCTKQLKPENVIRIQGTAEARRCGAVAVRSQVITWNSTLTLYALYLPLPPPYQLRLLFLRLGSLSPPLVLLHVVYRGVPK